MNTLDQSVKDARKAEFEAIDREWRRIHFETGKSYTKMLYDAKNLLIAEHKKEQEEDADE